MLMAGGHGSDGGVIMLPVAFFFFSREICDERTGDASLEIGSGLLAHVATIGRFKADGDNARPARDCCNRFS